MEYVIYCDESADKGAKYSDFFGGCMIAMRDLETVSAALEAKKRELHLFNEVKWSKVTEAYRRKYEELIHLYFDFVRSGKLRVRIMFRSNKDGMERTENQSKDKYFKLYYQFIKHGFGLKTIPEEMGEVFIRIYLDELPDTSARREEFKEFLRNMPNTSDFRNSSVHIRPDDIAEVRSHEHVLLQCTDIVLGSMYFRLNGLHLAKPQGQRNRGSRTIAKEKLYKYINKEIQTIHPRFNIGESTGFRGFDNPHWESPYEHWRFKSSEIK